MKKSVLTILSVCTLAAACCSFASVSPAKNTAMAEDTETGVNGLLLPSEYENYLDLTAPSDVAVCDDFKAIADGNAIYIYDEANGVYREYTHAPNTVDPSKNRVTKLQFDDADNLYFLDASTALYRLPNADLLAPETASATDTTFTCSTFILQGNTLYFTNVTTQTQLSKVPLDNLDKTAVYTLVDELSSKPTLTFWDGELYYTDSGKYLYKINPEATAPAETFVAAFPAELVSISVNSGAFSYTDIDGNFSVRDLSALTSAKDASEVPQIFGKSDQFTSLCVCNEFVYAVNGAAVWEYSVSEQNFTEAEICSFSSSIHRLNDAKQLLLTDEKLFIADDGNNRVSVYDVRTASFQTPIEVTLSASYLAANERTLLLANQTQAALYDLSSENYSASLWAYNGFIGELAGVAEVYGRYYFATENNRYYMLEQGENGWALTADVSKTYTRQTGFLTADAYGYLYTVSGNDVYRYTEADFLNPSSQTGEKICGTLPADTTAFAVDYEQNLYALSQNEIYKFTLQADGSYAQTNIDTNKKFVYGDTPTKNAFTFGIEENIAYILCDNGYIVQTDEFALPTVKNIPVNAVDQAVFSAESATVTIVKTLPNALLVEFDLAKLNGATVFPYLSYKRSEAPCTALKIGETDKYNLIAVFDKESNAYSTYLTLKTVSPEYDGEYNVEYAEAERQTAWLTNAIALYKFPYLTRLLTVTELPRGGEVTLLGEIGELDHEYYYVSFTDEQGEQKTGYIPKSYATPFDASPKKTTQTQIGKTESNDDAVWRLAYMLLGLAAIGILVDFLLLRKHNND